MNKILFIGAGNIGQAIIKGIINNKIYSNENIFIYDINQTLTNKLKEQLNINILKEFNENLISFEIIILAVKPQIFLNFENDNTMKQLKNISENSTIISVMAGISINKLSQFFIKNKNIVRVMPNTPALVNESMSAIAFNHNLDENIKNKILNIFNSIGKTILIDEKYFDAITALSGSGPAYVFLFIESLISAGIFCGLSKDISQELILQTIKGSIKMYEHNKNIEDLKYMVTSPGGTTIEALSVFEKYGFKGIIMEAVKSAMKKSEQLGQK